MKIGILQFDPEFGKKQKNIDRVRSLIGDGNADLIVLPELFNTGYQFRNRSEVRELAENLQNGVTVDFLTELAAEKNAYLVAGLAEKEKDGLFNSSVLIGEEGPEAVYRKIHLFYREKKILRSRKQRF